VRPLARAVLLDRQRWPSGLEDFGRPTLTHATPELGELLTTEDGKLPNPLTVDVSLPLDAHARIRPALVRPVRPVRDDGDHVEDASRTPRCARFRASDGEGMAYGFVGLPVRCTAAPSQARSTQVVVWCGVQRRRGP